MRNNPLTLEELVAPLALDEFFSLLRDRKLTHLRGTHRDRFTDLLGWDALRNLIERGEYPRGPDLRVSKESVRTPSKRWTNEGKIDPAKLEECMKEGDSVIFNRLDGSLAPLAELCNDIKLLLIESAKAGAIVSAGDAGALTVHYDVEDLIIIQIEGAKRWQIFGPPVSYPVKEMPKMRPPENAPFFDEVLEPGDFLLMPAGNWHHCQTVKGRSVHLGIAFVPPTCVHVVSDLASQLSSDEMFRMPLTRIETVPELEAFEAAVKDRLMEKISRLELADYLTRWNRGLKAVPPVNDQADNA